MEIIDFAGNNLYKFLAFIGVVIILTPTIFREKALELEIEIIEAEGEMQLLSYEQDQIRIEQETLELPKMITETEELEELMHHLLEKYNLAEKLFATGELSLDDFNQVKEDAHKISEIIESELDTKRDQINEIDIVIDDLGVRLRKITLLSIEMQTKGKIIKAKLDELDRIVRREYRLYFIGMIFLIFGVLLWYFQIQRYIDKQLIRSTRDSEFESKLELEDKSNKLIRE